VHLDFLTVDAPVTGTDTFKLGESAMFNAIGDSINWYADPLGVTLIGSGNMLVLNDLTDTTTVYAQNLISIEGDDYRLGPVSHPGTTKYSASFINGSLEFEVYEPVILHQVTVYTDSAGTRSIEISNGIDFFYEQQVDLLPGTTIIDLEVEIPVGSYTIGTSKDYNNLAFGIDSPLLWRSTDGVLYPYIIDGLVSITKSTFGANAYYYFYDWNLSAADTYCTSDLVPSTAYFELGTSTSEENWNEHAIVLAPNPTEGLIRVIVKTTSPSDLEVTNFAGKKLMVQSNLLIGEEGHTLNLTSYPPGMYLLHIIFEGKSYIRKIIRL
jgi:hypothetical protein